MEDERAPIKINMEILDLQGLSGHSDRNQLTAFIHRLRPQPRKVILVHGENSKCLELASAIHKQARIETNAPKNLESIRIR